MSSSSSHRFDRSFVIRMIRDFFIALVAVVILELLVRLGIVYYDYETGDKTATSVTADRLASDLKDVMLNAGGPVAARTIFPTWQRNYKEIGFEIGLIPSHVTVESIQKSYDFEPRGIKPDFPEGRFHEATVEITADAFCIGCHIYAKPGDVLGRVVVRNYFSTRLSQWWGELRVSLLVGMGNILLHTLVLFFLLRARMEPLLALRSQVARLARGRMDLSYRAEVLSDDEFGALAGDLNTFLDRLGDVIDDIDDVLSRVLAAKHRLDHAFDQITTHYDEIHTISQGAAREAYRGQTERELLSKMLGESVEMIDIVVGILDRSDGGDGIDEALRSRLREALLRLKKNTDRQMKTDTADLLVELTRHVQDSSHFLESMALIRERMEMIAESGQTLLGRLSGERDSGSEAEQTGSGGETPHESDVK